MDKIIIERPPSKIDKDGKRYDTNGTIPTKIPSKRLRSSRRCTALGSRSFPGSHRRFDHLKRRALSAPTLPLTVGDLKFGLGNGGRHVMDRRY